MDRARFRFILLATISMAHDYSLETRIRRLITDHLAANSVPKTLVMNTGTWWTLVNETEGYAGGRFWSPVQPPGPDQVCTFMGVPILVKEFMPDMEVVVGV